MADMELKPEFWRGRRVLLTGHTGFKGSWLSLWLQQLGAHVTGYALSPIAPSLFDQAAVGAHMTSIIGDVRNEQDLAAAIDTAAPEVVFHLAAQPLVRHSYVDPQGTWATNVMGTVHLLEVLRRRGGNPVVVVITSDKCYENHEWPWPYRESDPLGGHDPYSSSKAAVEIAAASWRRSYPDAFRLATARAGNVIGGGDWAIDRLLPDLIRAFSSRDHAHVRRPRGVRPWQHVLEPLAGYLQLAQALDTHSDRYADAWNFGPADSDLHTVGAIAAYVAELWGQDAHWQTDAADHPHEAGLLRVDSSKARQQLDWHPRWDTKQAVAATVDWYRRWSLGENMADFTRRQIEQYWANRS